MLYCYCVALLFFVLSYVLIVCTVPLPPGVNPIAVDKYIKSNNLNWKQVSRIFFKHELVFHTRKMTITYFT